MNKRGLLIITILIFIFAILIRVMNWPIITDINCDEAMAAINAKTIAETGADMYGTSFPVYFEAWGFGGQSALAVYLMAICIKIFGFSIYSIKLPALLLSLSSLFVIYIWMKKICPNISLSIIVLALLAINPWDITQSQWALDCNLFPHVFLIAAYLLYNGIENKNNICLYLRYAYIVMELLYI